MVIDLFKAERLNYGTPYVLTINGKKYKGILFEDCRITCVHKKNTYAYGLRHFEDDLSAPASITLGYPLVNFFGTFITKKEIPITEETDIEDWDWLN